MESKKVKDVQEKSLEITGALKAGIQQGGHFTQLDWVQDYCETILGYIPFPGTLNLNVKDMDLKQWQLLKTEARGHMLTPPTNEFCSAWLLPGYLGEMKVAAVVPLVKDYPEDLIELLAPVSLRAELNLKEGDLITVKFSV